MTPYIEDKNGNVYEFNNVSIKDKKEHEKRLQTVLSKFALDNLTEEEREKFLNPSADAKEKKEILNKSLKENLILAGDYSLQVHIETFKKLLKKTKEPNLTNEKVEEIIKEMYDEYGEEAVNERIVKINEKVFTQVGEISYKEMPTWGIED